MASASNLRPYYHGLLNHMVRVPLIAWPYPRLWPRPASYDHYRPYDTINLPIAMASASILVGSRPCVLAALTSSATCIRRAQWVHINAAHYEHSKALRLGSTDKLSHLWRSYICAVHSVCIWMLHAINTAKPWQRWQAQPPATRCAQCMHMMLHVISTAGPWQRWQAQPPVTRCAQYTA
jgi:hypothetical protein